MALRSAGLVLVSPDGSAVAVAVLLSVPMAFPLIWATTV